jgi:hypothetical protein
LRYHAASTRRLLPARLAKADATIQRACPVRGSGNSSFREQHAGISIQTFRGEDLRVRLQSYER